MRLYTLFLTIVGVVVASVATASNDEIQLLKGDEVVTGTIIDYMLTEHYGNPNNGCANDEKMFRVQGIPGTLCTPQCNNQGQCPTDVPDGVTAQPLCALSTPTGTHYCVLICQTNENNDNDNGIDNDNNNGGCGDAKCRSIKNQPGKGICTYDKEEDEDEDEEDGNFAGAW